MKNLLICVLILVALCVGPSVAQSNSSGDDPQQLREQMAFLKLRVAQLEHANGSSGAPSDSSSASEGAAPAHTMILVSVTQSDHTDDHSKQIAALKRQHAALMNTVNQAADQEDADLGQDAIVEGAGAAGGRFGATFAGGGITTNVGSMSREVMADGDMKERYATQAAIAKEKLDRLQNADSLPKQILIGHDPSGQKIYTLHTKVNLNTELDNIPIGSTVSWTGTRESADANGETWVVEMVHQLK